MVLARPAAVILHLGAISIITELATNTNQAVVRSRVAIIILNWNGWQDTIECLESVFRLSYPCFSVIVCDNASTDGSMEKIEDWSRGNSVLSSVRILPPLELPIVAKPVAFGTQCALGATAEEPPSHRSLVLIQTGANLGFAGGNNVGIRHAMTSGDCDYVWLLNNDTVPEPDALSAMVRMAEANPGIGICGSLLRNYHPPHDILTAGGRRYSRWSGRSRPLQNIATPRISTVRGAPDYVEGASMLISRRCLEQVGLLEEDYFLYSEEIDYVARAQAAFHFGYAPDSVVYHKEGASIGSAILRANRSDRSEFYLARSRLLFTWRHHPWFWPSVLATVAVSSLHRILIGKPRNAFAILRGALASFGLKLF